MRYRTTFLVSCTAIVRFKQDKIKFYHHEDRINDFKRDYPCCWEKISGKYHKKISACKQGTHDEIFATASIAHALSKKPWEGINQAKVKRFMTILVSAEGPIAKELLEASKDPLANLAVTGTMTYQHIMGFICPRIWASSYNVLTDKQISGMLTASMYAD